MRTWFAYLLCCRDGTLYVGIATDVQRRFEQHHRGQGSRFVKTHGVDHLVAWRLVGDGVAARRAEKQLKAMTRVRKLGYFRPIPYVGLVPPLSDATD
jgi:putative endonuclease